MAKARRWQIPFVSVAGTPYRIDIYDEGWTGSITTLTAGPNPFITDEDASDDFFAPIRTQTGNIEVCTALPDGGMLTLDEILPANNIARPIRLIRTDTTTIVWQGFLSCEAYSQDYVGIPQILQLPIISVLEAMASVYLTQENSSGFVRIGTALKAILTEIDVQCGMRCFDYLYYSQTDYDIFNKYIDQIILFEEKQYDTENSTSYIVTGMSAKDALQQLAVFMGWVVREYGKAIYLCRIGDNRGMYYELIEEFPGTKTLAALNISEMEDLEWRGVGHLQSVSQGAKSVEVVANLKHTDFSLSIPEFPYSDPTTLEWKTVKYNESDFKYFYSILEQNDKFYSNNEYGYFTGTLTRTGDYEYSAEFLGASDKETFLQRQWLHPTEQNVNLQIGANPLIAGACLMRYAIEDEETETHEMEEGLYCTLLPGCENTDTPIFKMHTPRVHSFNHGKLIIRASMLINILYRYNSLNQQFLTDKPNDSTIAMAATPLNMVLRVGDKYWDGEGWADTRTFLSIKIGVEGIDYEMPISEYLSGQVELEVLAGVPIGMRINTLYEVIFKSLVVDFEFDEDYRKSNRGSNHYYRLLGTNFRDEVSVSTDLATSLNNQPSPSLIMNNGETATTEITYKTDTLPELRRPEVDLLDRLAVYYQRSRQIVTLEVGHLQHPLPLLWLNGINDGKIYTPIAESRDWQLELSTLTCMEIPNE